MLSPLRTGIEISKAIGVCARSDVGLTGVKTSGTGSFASK
jgi:hypothetical protein